MVSQPRVRSPRRVIHEYKKSLREGKDKKRIRKRVGEPLREVKPAATEKEVSEATLKRLHTLGSQKFGSSPFSGHFDRWLNNVEAVLGEFESHPNIGIDDQYVRERSQALDIIKLQLEERHRNETALEQEIQNLSDYKDRLSQIDNEYQSMASAIKAQKNSEIKRLYSVINRLKREQSIVIRLKRGFFQRILRKDGENKEIEIEQELNDKQRELELVMLDFSAQQKELRDEYERKREPVAKQIKRFMKLVRESEVDGSLEDRWFACEALIDTVNTFLQRKAEQPQGNSNLPEV
jgi:hypothetical protein